MQIVDLLCIQWLSELDARENGASVAVSRVAENVL